MKRTPEIGDAVLVGVLPNGNNGSPLAPATVVRVWSDTTVNVRVLTDDAPAVPWLTSVGFAETAEEVVGAITGTVPVNRWTWRP